VTKEHGAMRYFAGSQALGELRMVDLGQPDDLLAEELPVLSEFPIVEVPAKPGDVVFHNCLVVHEAHPNVSNDDRLAYSVQYMPAGSGYNGWAHPFLEPLRLAEGDELNQDDYFPPVTGTVTGRGSDA
jgi:ectoine hydroxylase-related dioxygenase (phytanoyl-CoA dioxygenase family)